MSNLSKEDLADLGYQVNADPDQEGKFYWKREGGDASDISFDSEDEAYAAAIHDALTLDLSRCADCGGVFESDKLDEIRHATLRVEPGDETPSGQCPKCGALCFLIEPEDDVAQLASDMTVLADLLVEASSADIYYDAEQFGDTEKAQSIKKYTGAMKTAAELLKILAEGQMELLKMPTIVLDVEGGVVQDVNSDMPARVIILDGDTEGGGEQVREIDGEEVYVSEYILTEEEAAKEYVEKIVREVDAEVRGDQFTEILQHRVKWWLRDFIGQAGPKELDECSIEHIEKCIKEGYREGELVVLDDDGDTEFRGWWSIVWGG